MSDQNEYQIPMLPWRALQEYGKNLEIEDDLEIFYFEAGRDKKPTLIMLHGLGDEADTWRHVFLPLAKKYHVIALDLPGFGRSDKPDVAYTPQFMMKAVIGMMDRIGIEKGVLMGSSLGGILSHGLALMHPERVSGLILVGGGLLQHDPMGDWSLRLMQIPFLGEWLYTRLRKDPQAAYDSLRSVYHKIESLPKEDRDFLYTRVNQRVWSDGQRRAYFSTLRKLIPWVRHIQSELPEKLTKLAIPTLVLRGEVDSLFSEENAKGIVKVQPNAALGVIDGSGHLPQQETPHLFLDVIKTWLKRSL